MARNSWRNRLNRLRLHGYAPGVGTKPAPLFLAARRLAWLVAIGASVRAADAGTVVGSLDFLGSPPPRPATQTRGYLDRSENPLLPVRPVDPLPAIVVVLESATAPAATTASAVTWDLLGDSFARAVQPVAVGADVVIRNRGRGAPVLVAAQQPDLLPKKPLNPTAELRFVAQPAGVLDLADQSTPHLHGRILVLPTNLFAAPSAAGRFEIANVPPGTWTVRVWYDRGWVDRPDETITVGAGRLEINPKLPSGLPIKP